MKLPIRLNSKKTSPVTVVEDTGYNTRNRKYRHKSPKNIGKRELYFYQTTNNDDTYTPAAETEGNDEYEMWFGDENGTAKPTVTYRARIADSIRTKGLIKVNYKATEGIIGGMWVQQDDSDKEIITEPRAGYDATINKVTLSDIQKIVLNSNNFGTDESKVKNPVLGQLFFKI